MVANTFCLHLLFHQFAHQVGVAGGVVQRQARDEQGLTVQQLRVLFRLLRVFCHGVFQGLEHGMLHIQLQNAVGFDGGVGLDGLEILFHLKAQPLAGGEADGVGLQTGAGLDFLDLAAQGLLHEVKSGLVAVGGLLGLLLRALLNLLVQDGAQLLVVLAADGLGAELVDVLREVQDLDALVLQQLRLGQPVYLVQGLTGSSRRVISSPSSSASFRMRAC